MPSIEHTKGGKILLKLEDVVVALDAGEAMELASQLASAAMSASLYSNEVLLRDIEETKLRRSAYTP
jgi:hypothetical protein